MRWFGLTFDGPNLWLEEKGFVVTAAHLAISLTGFGFLVGAIVGSFLNVVILRYGTKQSALHGRSHCPHCHKPLGLFELIPILSYLLQGGRCRHCRAQIGWHYPLIELISACGTAAIIHALPSLGAALILSLIFWTALVIVAIDVRQLIIPDVGVVLLAVLALLWRLLHPGPNNLEDSLLGLFVAGGFLSLLIILTRGQGMGWGDAKLASALGLLLGFRLAIVMLLGAFLLGALVGIILLMERKTAWRTPLPFAPFLLLGASLAMIWGESIASWLGLLAP